MKTALYRHFDAVGDLLYVGISLSAVSRLAQHRSSASWYDQIANMTIEYFPSRAEAIEAETAAIRSERPKHNIIHAVRPATGATITFDMLKQQAVEIARCEARRREKEMAEDKPAETYRLWTLEEILARERPTHITMGRAWAKLAAHFLTSDEWDEIVWHCNEVVPFPSGSAVGFFERLFECMTLKDGALIAA